MRTTAVICNLVLVLTTAACGGEEPLPAMPEPAAPADEGGDLDSLGAETDEEGAPAEGAAPAPAEAQ